MKILLKNPWSNIGNTRLIKITDKIYGKLETENPTGSIKDRPVQFIVKNALKDGELNSRSILVEASSGNTGISLSAIGANLGLPVKIIMPSNMSEERKQMMRLFGAEIIDAPPSDFKSAIQMRNELVESNSTYWSPMQFENLLNIKCHRETTAKEIIQQALPHGQLEAFFSGAGTGGTIMGARQAFQEYNMSTKSMLVVPAEPSECHGIQGIGDGGDYLVHRDEMDSVFSVKTDHAIKRAKQFAKSTGLLVGISSGANLVAAEKYVQEHNPEGIVVIVLCDRGERYLSLF